MLCLHLMQKVDPDWGWTIVLHIVMWTVLTVGLVMMMAVLLMRR